MLRVVALAALLLFALVATATPARAGTSKRGPAIVVYAGPPSMAKVLRVNLQADAPAFFPANVTIRASQSITWRIHGFHTITFPDTNPNLPLVVPHDPRGDSEAGKEQLSKVVSELKRLNSTTPTSARQILVGAGASGSAEIMSFFPSELNINVGDTVTFVDNDPTDVHTVTFGPEEYTSAIENTVFEYAGARLVFNPLSALPSEPPDSPSPVPYDGTNHGNGYINSGLLYPPQVPNQLHEFAITLTKAGTYRLECVIHSQMDATIIVH